MYIYRALFAIILSLLVVNCVALLSSVEASMNPQVLKKENEELKEMIENLRQRMSELEPPMPVNIADPPWEEPTFPTKVKPVSEIIHKGAKIPFDVIVNKPDYERLAYEKHWHSSVGGGRWSYVPNRIHYALHRLFTKYDIGLSSWYDFEQNIGFSIPMFQNENALDLYIVAFKTEVTDVYTSGNQVVVVGNPIRKGVQVITITTLDINPSDKAENLLVQLSTQQGHEIDYSTISYISPDFWKKQSEKLKDRER